MSNLYYLAVFSLLMWVGPSGLQPVMGQPPNSREVSPQPSFRVSVLEQQKQALESDLQQRIRSYHQLPNAARSQARIDIESLLFALFDLNMSQLESQSKSLRETLRRMEQDPNYRQKTREIEQLKAALREVENSLSYRRQYRNQIVSQKLSELIGG